MWAFHPGFPPVSSHSNFGHHILSPFIFQNTPHYGAEKLVNSFFPYEYFMSAKTYIHNINCSTKGKINSQLVNYL